MSSAARQGDLTQHGGVITSGCATVLIEGKPAARAGDSHACPMLNPGVPPPPHVGGALLGGCPTVFIGGMPAARVGDAAICIGPPDTIATGAATVLIGSSTAPVNAADQVAIRHTLAAVTVAAAAAGQSPPVTAEAKHWLDCCFVDEQKYPVSGAALTVTGGEGESRLLGLSGDGTLKLGGLNQDDHYSISLARIRELSWSPESTDFAEPVTLTCLTEAVANSETAVFSIYRLMAAGADVLVGRVEQSIQANQARWSWRYEHAQQLSQLARFYATVSVMTMQSRSALLTYRDMEQRRLMTHAAPNDNFETLNNRVLFSAGANRLDTILKALENRSSEIVATAEKYGIDPRSIAAAIAWEFSQNTPGYVSDAILPPLNQNGYGYGEMHRKTLQDDVLPGTTQPETVTMRRDLGTMVGLVGKHIGKQRDTYSVHSGGIVLSANVAALAWLYNTRYEWVVKVASDKAPIIQEGNTPFLEIPNDMAYWTNQNLDKFKWLAPSTPIPTLGVPYTYKVGRG